ncbi:F-box protein [Corchorus olitorius]|uniref:F-box protein n=1 Tax=Corchorus olitorius TaxID=93759 RepID=A0A1R3KWH3_9ROSI|nr:F-box protein [Corchorus olitorius]
MGYLRLLLEKLQNSVGKKKGHKKNFDPEDPETIDMLCSLPAENVWKIRKASKGLRDLIQSPDFASRIYGLYYHSSTQEYRLLYLRNHSNGLVQDYGIIKAGENAGRRLYLQLDQRIPCPKAQPPAAVAVKNFLYWRAESAHQYYYQPSPRPCQHSIIGFDTDAEELFTLPHPDDNICQPSTPHCQMRLLEMDGRLTCWCLGVASAHVWVLNYDECNNIYWSLRCHLNFDHDLFFKYSPGNDIKLVSFLNNEVLLVWSHRVFRYNLSTRNVRNLKGFKHGFYLIPVAHTKSVVVLEDQRVGQPIYFESKQDKSRWIDQQVKHN